VETAASTLVKKGAELDGAMTALAHADHRAGRNVQSAEQGCGAVALVIMVSPLDLIRAHRQDRRGAFNCFDLRLLVDIPYHRPIEWVEVEPDYIEKAPGYCCRQLPR